MEYNIWTYEEIRVHYTQDLDGDGTSMAGLFVDYLKVRHKDVFPVECIFEWCAGPGFLGYALLAAGLCRRLVLADINPRAVASARKTAEVNGLAGRVSIYEGDNLRGIPPSERFDLVVSNPPNYYCLNPAHPAYLVLKDDLRPNDPGWRLHRDFYRRIASHLNDGALLCIEEVDPYAEKCYLPNPGDRQPVYGPEPFDIRPRAPILDFIQMIHEGGLEYLDTVRLDHPEFPVHIVLSRWPGVSTDRRDLRVNPEFEFYERIGRQDDGRLEIIGRFGLTIHGQLSPTEQQTWIVDLLELLSSVKGRAVSYSEIQDKLDLAESSIDEISDILRKLSWIC
jgi:hypothetical protein